MKSHTFSCAIYLLFILLTITTPVLVNSESILNWIWNKKEENPTVIADGVPLINIPYEMLTEDEKFLKEAAKLVTDIQISSPLEICQHKVVMKIKTSCSSMTEEQLAKLSVSLLNCQSETEGRRTYPCTDEMTIKQCTMHMDADTWNAYHLMSNRARAVCYAARSHQFRALTELTVNKLMQSAHTQIQTLATLKDSQDRMEEQTLTAHKIIETNIQDLTDEKALIRAGHEQLAAMTEDIQKKLEKANQDLKEQAERRGDDHMELLSDLRNIQNQAELLWEKIEISTNRIIEQNQDAAKQYGETLEKLEKINQTIVYVWNLTNTMRSEIDQKLGWITEYIGATGENLEKVYKITLHVVYLLGAMVAAAFLQAPFLTRSAILGLVPLNLASYLKHGLSACLDFVSLTILIILITAMHYLMNGIQYLIQARAERNQEKERHVTDARCTNGRTLYNGNGHGKVYDDENCETHVSLNNRISWSLSIWWSDVKRQIRQSLENMQNAYMSMKYWISQKFTPTEELSCSYLPAKKYNIYDKSCPSISDDSEYDSRESDKFRFTSDHDSMTGAVLRRKYTETPEVSPLTAFFKGTREPNIRETMLIKRHQEKRAPSVTPISKPMCAARTRSGNPCRLVASRGQNYCHRHASGSSVVGD